VGLTTLPCKKKTVERPPRNSAGFCGGGQGLSWAVEPRKEEEEYSVRSRNYEVRHYVITSILLPVPLPWAQISSSVLRPVPS
jgi:hypothetical protein